MTELKKSSKRPLEPTNKPAVKKLKPSPKTDKPSTEKNPKKFEKNGKFNKKFNSGGKNFKKGGHPQQQQPKEGEKTNWNELKKKKKELKVQRRMNKSKELYDVDQEAKKIYEQLKM